MRDGSDDQKRRESIALFRHALIGDLVHEDTGLYAKLRIKAERDYEIPFSRRRRVAVETLRDWLRAYRRSNLTNAEALREKLEARGSIFQSISDTEVIVHLVATSTQRAVEDRIADALSQVQGAYSLLCLTQTSMLAVRDPMGIRPLCVGVMPGEPRAYVVASEPTAFDLIDAEWVRDIEPGEMIVFDRRGMKSLRPFASTPRRSCIFEYVYFARPDSRLDGINVYEARKNLGRELAREHPVEADVVIPVPDSGVPATIGYAEEAKIPFEMGLVRSHYVGRTFIEPQQSIRHFGVRLKLNPVSDTLRGKRVVVVDDSIVRGTTSRKIVKMVRAAGAGEVHMRISSPPTAWPCYYGIDTPTRAELIASSHSVDDINRYITSDTLAYLSRERMIHAVIRATVPATPSDALATEHNGNGQNRRMLPVMNQALASDSFCHACWSGEYPIRFTPHPRQRQMRLLDS